MSKIAELLKLAEQKKEERPKFEIVPSAPQYENKITNQNNPLIEDKGKQVEVSVSKGKYREVSVSKGKQVEVEDGKIIITGNETANNNSSSNVEISPARDFTKVSNSITKRAIPEKYFRGLSKHTYDVLYQRTRGAINPTRSIQLTKDELVRLTGLSKDAIKLHIKYLKEIGLLDSRPVIGSHAGWEYEIFVPEEIEETEQVGVRQGKARQGKASENLPLHTVQNLPLLTHTNPIENKDTYVFPNTSLKTNTKNDDDARVNEAFSAMNTKLDIAVERLTGKGVSRAEAKKWEMLADLLILEMESAASRTGPISSAPAFLTEVLRRKVLSGNSPGHFTKLSETKVDFVGKPNEAGDYEIKPLNKEGREAAFIELQEFANDDLLADFQKWYTAEDWTWLKNELEKIIPVKNKSKNSE